MNIEFYLRSKIVNTVNCKEIVLQDLFLYGDNKRIAVYDRDKSSWFGMKNGKVDETALYDLFVMKR